MNEQEPVMVWYFEVKQNGKWGPRLKSGDAPRISKEMKRFHTEPKQVPLEKQSLDEYAKKYGINCKE